MRIAISTLSLAVLLGAAPAAAQQPKPDTTKPKPHQPMTAAKPAPPAATAGAPAGQTHAKPKKHKKTKPDSTTKKPNQ